MEGSAGEGAFGGKIEAGGFFSRFASLSISISILLACGPWGILWDGMGADGRR